MEATHRSGGFEDTVLDMLGTIHNHLVQIKKELHQMAVDQATFDTDLAALVSSIGDLEAAVEAFIASKPAADFTTEEQTLADAAAKVKTTLDEVAAAAAPPAPPA